jgi:putative phosphoesterase
VAAVRIAAIADVHGNALALEAVLAEVARERPDRIVVCGDVAAGPEPRAVLDRLMELEDARFVRGNADRELVAGFDGGTGEAAWGAERIDRAHRDFVAGFADVVREEDVLFCHGSPRSDTEILTSLTPEAHVRRALAGVAEPLVVGGHTHVQYVRSVGRTRLVNAGSVGMAYEGRRGAFWALLGPGGVELRRTDYDYARAAARVRASGYPDAESFSAENVLDPPDATAAEGLFERMAIERGERG